MRQKGFTIIELMMVIVIIGILATMAIPAYQDYVVRARVTEGINLSSTAKMSVSEWALMNHQFPPSQEAAGYDSPTPTSNVASITIANATGMITIRYTKAAGDGTIIWVPALHEQGDVSWSCKEGTLASKYRPAICR